MAADEGSFKLPTAQEAMEKLALAEAEKASAALHKQSTPKPRRRCCWRSSPSRRASPTRRLSPRGDHHRARRLERLTEVQVYRFPNALCTDHGRAINQQEQGWETTLTGLPKEMFQFWERQLRPRGYKIKFQIVDFPDGMPGMSASR